MTEIPGPLPRVESHRKTVHRPPRLSAAALRAEWPLVLVLTGIVAAVMLMVFDRWRRGAFAIGIVALAAVALRAVLPEHRIGLLAIRSRWFDMACYALTGAVIIWLSLSVDSLGTG